ncbi:helix-turn-helix domain-containing protein [Hahella sp. KA22]|uniref:helix-turn-helix domain-containing protein n=1 Tax=Hahella sp. KA22 TaxID=1628392 RepID=UPI000FDD1D2E|nr:helix-turn-helix domain-containing protein [Hahella sp. KA22]AZZ93636.1 helix-turn-helix domain-containing protein [Hahella sp. KA22]QAY57011.1 helix-turn-helix domain-containing protein [Hahella sp. KA22]
MTRAIAIAAREPRELIENRVSFAGPNSELSVYDTYLPAQSVGLSADELLYCGMISGRKILHGRDDYTAEFLPQESFVMAPGETISIDFPDAELNRPTSCLTVEISRTRVDSICSHMNKVAPLHKDFEEWRYRTETLIHTPHTQATQALLERMIATFSENGPDRDILIDLGVSELVVRMLRQQTRAFLLGACESQPDINGLAAALSHIQKHITQPLDIGQLCRIACMSRSRFFAEFKSHFGCAPAEFQQQLRLQRAGERLRQGESVTRVCFDLGYRNLSHFSRRFQRQYGRSPSQYQKQLTMT